MHVKRPKWRLSITSITPSITPSPPINKGIVIDVIDVIDVFHAFRFFIYGYLSSNHIIFFPYSFSFLIISCNFAIGWNNTKPIRSSLTYCCE